MCVEAEKGFELQSGREYGFGSSELPSRHTTELHKLQPEELLSMPTNNILCERLLAIFSHRADVSKFRNKNFTAKGIKENIVLHQANQFTVTSINKSIQKLLSQRDNQWTSKQKKKQKERIQEKIKKAENNSTYLKKLLQSCKTWGGPCTTPNELEMCIKNKPDIAEKIVKTELSYYVHTHQAERNVEPALFKIMIPHEERLENLLVLLGDNSCLATSLHASALDLPTNNDLSKFLNCETEDPVESSLIN